MPHRIDIALIGGAAASAMTSIAGVGKLASTAPTIPVDPLSADKWVDTISKVGFPITLVMMGCIVFGFIALLAVVRGGRWTGKRVDAWLDSAEKREERKTVASEQMGQTLLLLQAQQTVSDDAMLKNQDEMIRTLHAIAHSAEAAENSAADSYRYSRDCKELMQKLYDMIDLQIDLTQNPPAVTDRRPDGAR